MKSRAERSPGPRARERKTLPCGPGLRRVCHALPHPLVRMEGQWGHEPPTSSETPAGPAEPRKPGVPPSRSTCCRGRTGRSIYTRGASPHGGAQGGGRGRRPARPRPVLCGPAPMRGPPHSGCQDPPLPPGSAARCRVWGLAEGRASLRKATSRPFLQCE